MKIDLKNTLLKSDSLRKLSGLDRLVSEVLNEAVIVKDEYRSAVQEEIYSRLKKTLKSPKRYLYLNERYLSSDSIQDHSKIAKSFNVSRAAVSQSISRSMRVLRESFEEDSSIAVNVDEKFWSNRKFNYLRMHEVIDRIFQDRKIETVSVLEAEEILKYSTVKTSLEGVNFSKEMLRLYLVGEYRLFEDSVVKSGRLSDQRHLKDFRRYNFSIYKNSSSKEFDTMKCEKLKALCDIEDFANDLEFHDSDRAVAVANSILLDKSSLAYDLGFQNFRRRVDRIELIDFLVSENLSIESSRIIDLSKLDAMLLAEDDTDRLVLTKLSDDQIEFFDNFFLADIRLNGYGCESEIFVRSSSLKIYDLLHSSKIITTFKHSEYPSLSERVYDLLQIYESMSESSSEIDFIKRLHKLSIFEDDLIRYIYRLNRLDKEFDPDDFYVVLDQSDLLQLQSELKRFFNIDRSLEDLRLQYAAF